MGKIINFLRSGLYPNPVKAMVQETLSNAFDANVAYEKKFGKKPRTIEISLPSGKNNLFRVKDFGIGIAPDKVETVYLSFGESTKENDEDSIGAFGLGAKSGFAVSSSFSVTIVYDKVKREYLCEIDSSKEGVLHLLSETAVNEINSVEVQIPIQDKDFSRVKEETLKTVFMWDIKPEFTNADGELKLNVKSMKMRSSFLTLGGITLVKKREVPFPMASVNLNAGGILYRCDQELYADKYGKSTNQTMDSLLQSEYALIIDADPSKMKIAASRDGFQNSNYGTECINNAIQVIDNFMGEKMKSLPLTAAGMKEFKEWLEKNSLAMFFHYFFSFFKLKNVHYDRYHNSIQTSDFSVLHIQKSEEKTSIPTRLTINRRGYSNSAPLFSNHKVIIIDELDYDSQNFGLRGEDSKRLRFLCKDEEFYIISIRNRYYKDDEVKKATASEVEQMKSFAKLVGQLITVDSLPLPPPPERKKMSEEEKNQEKEKRLKVAVMRCRADNLERGEYYREFVNVEEVKNQKLVLMSSIDENKEWEEAAKFIFLLSSDVCFIQCSKGALEFIQADQKNYPVKTWKEVKTNLSSLIDDDKALINVLQNNREYQNLFNKIEGFMVCINPDHCGQKKKEETIALLRKKQPVVNLACKVQSSDKIIVYNLDETIKVLPKLTDKVASEILALKEFIANNKMLKYVTKHAYDFDTEALVQYFNLK